MRCATILYVLCFPLFLISQNKTDGFIDYTWNDDSGALSLHLDDSDLGQPFLYVNSLATGVGSNDIGLDRGQLGDKRVVRFYKSGNKVLLIEDNLDYRALSDNPEEVKAIEEAFAESVIFGFKIINSKKIKTTESSYEIDATSFLLRDAHNVAKRIENTGQGMYKLDKSKSAIYKEGLYNFPDNTEMEALLTFTGNPKGNYLSSVTPTAELVTVRQHHSFIRLPDDNYTPREFMPESGYFYTSFQDYASPIGADMTVRYINRHRLEKVTPGSAPSIAKEPIVYYIDRGCPEPVKSALIEGASWWNQAFEAAGYIDAFQVKELPEDAHPLDVRYNMIQWVHRSTRGWSYGASITDPRTGEILKGHVSLGSLRVRQDYMIAKGLLASASDDLDKHQVAMDMSLARLRQLSAHEVGHTIGLAHNFAASYNNRASVMDYPHPKVTHENGEVDFSEAYAVGIGEWDKIAVTYGYASSPQELSEKDFLKGLIKTHQDNGYKYITDQDARPQGGIHPLAHLWDNGSSAIEELNRIMNLRRHTLNNFDASVLPSETPYSELEKVIVPVYLMHRYQVEAAAKLIAGSYFSYSVYPEEENELKKVNKQVQSEALSEILNTLDESSLAFPPKALSLINPPAYGYPRDRETFKGKTGARFDDTAAAESWIGFVFSLLLNPERLARIERGDFPNMSLSNYLDKIDQHVQSNGGRYAKLNQKVLYIKILELINKSSLDITVKSHLMNKLNRFIDRPSLSTTREYITHHDFIRGLRDSLLESPSTFDLPGIQNLPPGSPIGCYGK